MAKIYTTDGKIVVGGQGSQIQIKDKLYAVDCRKSTFDKMQKELNEGAEDKVIMEYALGKKATKEITDLDLTVSSFSNLIIYIFAAIQDIEFEEAKSNIDNAKNTPS